MIISLFSRNTFKVCVALICLIVALLSIFVFKMGNDNPIEQLSEQIIKMETGVDIDLTPQRKEK